MNFKEMQRAVHENSVKHGFWDGHVSPHDVQSLRAAEERAGEHRVLLHGENENRSIPAKLALIHSEVSEALECYRNGEMAETLEGGFTDEEGACYPPTKPVGLPSELADIVIRVMDLAEALGIDLEGAIERKHAYNVTRPYRHGGKAI